MIINTEKYQDKVYILDGFGRIWRFEIAGNDQPQIIQLQTSLSSDAINRMMNYRPLSTYDDRC